MNLRQLYDIIRQSIISLVQVQTTLSKVLAALAPRLPPRFALRVHHHKVRLTDNGPKEFRCGTVPELSGPPHTLDNSQLAQLTSNKKN